jgi:hypothetical protein
MKYIPSHSRDSEKFFCIGSIAQELLLEGLVETVPRHIPKAEDIHKRSNSTAKLLPKLFDMSVFAFKSQAQMKLLFTDGSLSSIFFIFQSLLLSLDIC